MAQSAIFTGIRLRWLVIAVFLGVAALGGVGVAGRQLSLVLAAAEGETPLHFDQGLTAVDPRAPAGWTNDWCGSCHEREYESWKASRHYVAAVNENFQAQFGKAPQQWCLNCHAPINPGRDQMPNVRLPTGEPTEDLFRRAPDWLTSGVDCLTCHVRDGRVIAAGAATAEAEQAHPVRVVAGLGKAEFCAGCHQFRFKSSALEDGFMGQNQQASLEEFLDRSQAGGVETRCHDCHMPQGNHRMPGGYDLDMLRRAVGLKLRLERLDEPTDDQPAVRIEVEVSARRVGHRVPGGEYFRFLTVHTTLTDATGAAVAPARASQGDLRSGTDERVVTAWPQVETIRRRMGSFERGEGGQPLTDTRIWPGDSRTFSYRVPLPRSALETPLTARTEIWYYVLDDDETRDHGLKPEDTQWVVRTEETRLEPSSPP